MRHRTKPNQTNLENSFYTAKTKNADSPARHIIIGGACVIMVTGEGMDTAIRVQIRDQSVCISNSANTFGKSMNLTIQPPAMGKPVGRTEFFSLGIPTSLGKGKL